MKNNWVITIGREFCTGGAKTAKKLAEVLQFEYLDKELIDETAELLSVSKELVMKRDEKPEGYFDVSKLWYIDEDEAVISLSDAAKVAEAQSGIIRRYAEQGSCVIVGRCADYVLKDNPHLLRVFFHSDMDKRIQRAMELYDLSEAKAERMIRKTDKQRATYYNHNTRRKKWGLPDNYDLYLDLGSLGVDGAIDVIIKELEKLDS